MGKRVRRTRPRDWLDFRAIKSNARFEAVLEHYDTKFTRRGDELTCRCPFHDDRKPSFKVNTAKGVFHCFGCQAKGNVIDFVQRKEGGTIRQAAQLVIEICDLETTTEEPMMQETNDREKSIREPEGNRPLELSLQLDVEHPYLEGRGLEPDTVALFGLGHCKRGMMRGRIAIPIHDERGQLVAYAGRWSGAEEDPPAKDGKYKLPPKFHKSLVLFNLHRVPADARTVVLVEGFFSVFWIHQVGIPNVVAMMGTALSDQQLALLTNRFKGVRLFLDGDTAGREAAARIATQLATSLWIRIVTPPEGKQPDELAPAVLTDLLS